jgi:hypothetical protein
LYRLQNKEINLILTVPYKVSLKIMMI